MRVRRTVRVLAAAAAFLAGEVAPLAAQDVVVVASGVEYRGEVKELQRAKLKLDTDAADNIYIEWDKVRALTARGPFEIELETGALYFGSIEPAADSGRARIVEFNRTIDVPFDSIVTITQIEATFWARVDGNLEIGFNFAKANQTLNLSSKANVVYRGRRVEHRLVASAFVQSSDDSETSRRLTITAQSTRQLADHWLAGLYGGLERNDELGLDLRATIAAVGGRVLERTNHVDWQVLAGLSWNREQFTGEGEASTTYELPIGSTFDWFVYGDDETALNVTFSLYPSLSDFGRIRGNLDVSLRKDILKDFYVSLSGYDSFDSRPPVEAEKNDYGVSFTVGYDL